MTMRLFLGLLLLVCLASCAHADLVPVYAVAPSDGVPVVHQAPMQNTIDEALKLFDQLIVAVLALLVGWLVTYAKAHLAASTAAIVDQQLHKLADLAAAYAEEFAAKRVKDEVIPHSQDKLNVAVGWLLEHLPAGVKLSKDQAASLVEAVLPYADRGAVAALKFAESKVAAAAPAPAAPVPPSGAGK
jgi:hypothetical protein